MTADIVVAGAGHNSLITAAYLAASGREVLVLDSRAIPGGGAATEELLGPGYLIDSCSTGHTLIQTNPLLLDDELGLKERYGLEYLVPDPFAHVAFPDGEQLTAWMDLERTVEEIARFSKADGEAYRRLLAEYDEVKHIFAAGTFNPVGFGPSVEQLLREHPRGNVWLRRRALSAWDVIRHEFESRHVQGFLLWQAYQTLVPIESPGSGPLAYSIVFGRQRRSWTIPRGGSGRLTDALVDCIVEHGGTVLCGRRVVRLVVRGRPLRRRRDRGRREAISRARRSSRRSTSSTCSRWRRRSCGRTTSATASTPSTSACRPWPSTSRRASRRCSRRPTVRAPPCRPASRASREDALEYGRALADGRYVEDPAWILVAYADARGPLARAARATTRSSSSPPSRTGSRGARTRRRGASSSGCGRWRRTSPTTSSSLAW